MDPARAAAMSDPEKNRWFRRRWAEPVTRNPQPLSAVIRADRTHTSPEQIGLHLREAWRQARSRGQKGKSA
jgi:hypothetical protein